MTHREEVVNDPGGGESDQDEGQEEAETEEEHVVAEVFGTSPVRGTAGGQYGSHWSNALVSMLVIGPMHWSAS